MANTFLKAEWRKLAMANYVIDPSLLAHYLPYKTELDLWQDRCYVSLVGFMFKNTRLKGLRIPYHVNFEEVNLRFYVRYKEAHTWKRGVVFIKEIVPKPALSFVANRIYKENYETMPMRHTWVESNERLDVTYEWKKQTWNSFTVIAANAPVMISHGSEEEFITEHYWGYTKIGTHQTAEYGVEHPAWEVYPTIDHTIDVDFENIYGSTFGFLSHQPPLSVFLAEGSDIVVKSGRTIT